MGFRSTLTSEDYPIEWPEWFKKDYDMLIASGGMLRSEWEMKAYAYDELPNAIQKALEEVQPTLLDDEGYTIVWLHECGGVTKVQIMHDEILIATPTQWATQTYEHGLETEDDHGYGCDGCSDLRKVAQSE